MAYCERRRSAYSVRKPRDKGKNYVEPPHVFGTEMAKVSQPVRTGCDVADIQSAGPASSLIGALFGRFGPNRTSPISLIDRT
jgi:hypothetical protein